MTGQSGLPSRPRAPAVERRSEGREANVEVVLGCEPGDIANVFDEHVVAVQQMIAVQPHVGERRQTPHAQQPGPVAGIGESTAKPPVAPVEQVAVGDSPRPVTVRPERARRGSGNVGRDPRAGVEIEVGRSGRGAGISRRALPAGAEEKISGHAVSLRPCSAIVAAGSAALRRYSRSRYPVASSKSRCRAPGAENT